MARLAFFTFGVLHEAIPHPDVQGFVDRLGPTWESAESAPGFLGRASRERPWGPIVAPRFYDPKVHPTPQAGQASVFAAPATLSLWQDIQSVQAFAYGGSHLEALQKRRDWFRQPAWPTYVAWWVDDDHTPTWLEACERLESLHDHGPGPGGFTFKQAFDETGNPA